VLAAFGANLQWLCHADARQVSDLQARAPLFLRVFDPAVMDRSIEESFGKSRLAAHQRGKAGRL
jgi:hypothetical protein